LNKYKEWLKTIESTDELNGGGPILAPIFQQLLSGRKFKTAFEWCAGPAWIGMWLLENGICETLVTGDINKKTVRLVRETAKKHNYDIRAYVSDNLKDIPQDEKFDLVISNPPNYCNIQRSHTHGYMRNDLRPSDVGWEIHEDFYNNISNYLNDDAVMFISEVELYNREVYIFDELYDKRSELPIDEFNRMTASNNLTIANIIAYSFEDAYNNLMSTSDIIDIHCYILEIHKQLN
jgi:hypothetical protein